ncbi:MAG: HigA family addiction module antidote protein [Microcystis sp. M038S2]|jgi:addiction module HigA family antidote|uniref:HigA family addiction module antidote protein n=1 Tax=Microcystis aeruginosa G11-04 TaxID=2685956 RepID=A0A966L7E0_MICAE|nr:MULTISPECIES: HigA family addiction module antitoxin [unclassified Microcystis]MCU7245827.1 HigA family addiction module antitoxin [Microcystis aeruginosa WS75]NCQ69078.1 HigA family addiction module antidote protein [Microcystis aeruginosa W13-16]NCQ73616.1 HigA family addiction module antidote protein [Microcystis aeruginosa W13-13]NCQ78094.1 HigA family addiction module antidote protein [Microcystis aeruginosa W13-15]NCR46977.1 HigA family addiction module antidote protein [Microcystis a
MNNWKSPIHPGEILADELEEINLDVSQLAKRVNISENELEQILKGQGNITGDIALRLGRFFNTGAEIWMNLQKAYELDIAREKLGNPLEEIIPYQSLSSG